MATVNDNDPRVEYTATASQTVFTRPFFLNAEADLDVYANGVLVASGYTHTGVGANTGTLVFTTGRTAGDIIILTRSTAKARSSAYTNGQPLPASALEDDNTRALLLEQEAGRDIGRALRIPITDTAFEAADLLLPAKATRASKVLSFDADGLPTVTTLVDGSTASNAASLTFDPAGSGAVARTVQAKLRDIVSVADYGAAPAATAAENVTAIQAALNAAAGRVLYFPATGTYSVNAAMTVSSGTTITGALGAIITQTVADTEIFNIEGKSNILICGLAFAGKADDYSDSDSSRAVAIYGGTSGENNHVFRNKFTGFTYTPARFAAQDKCSFVDNIVVGPGSPELTSVTDGKCYGVLFDSGCDGVNISGNDISACAQGARVEAVTACRITGNRFHDIVGQHGIYVGSAMRDITITGNTVYNVDLMGIKVQAADAAAVDNIGITITGNTVYDCGDQGIGVVSGNSGATYKNRGVTITGNTIRDCVGNGIYTDNTVGGVINGNTIDLCDQSGIVIDEVSEIDVVSNTIKRCVNSAIRDIAACTYICIEENIIKDCATGNTVGDRFGIYIAAAGSEYTIAGNIITDADAKMQYGIYIGADINATLTMTDNIVVNATDSGVRFSATTALRKYSGNVWNGTIGLAFNDPVLPAVASAGTITLPTGHDVISITGTTSITSVNAAGHSGHRVTLVFAGILTFTDGSNLKLAGDFVTTADDCISLVCDGTNWYETARSTN